MGLCCALGLSAFSVVLLLGIQQMGVIGRRTVLMQVVAAGLGFIAAMVLAHLDYEQLGSWWKFYVPVAVVLMLLTFTPLGQTRTDSIETNRSWLNLGFTTIQPAEFLKIAFILSLAYHLSKVGASLNGSKTLLRVGAHAIFPVLLILLQKDWGVALVMLFIVVVMSAATFIIVMMMFVLFIVVVVSAATLTIVMMMMFVFLCHLCCCLCKHFKFKISNIFHSIKYLLAINIIPRSCYNMGILIK